MGLLECVDEMMHVVFRHEPANKKYVASFFQAESLEYIASLRSVLSHAVDNACRIGIVFLTIVLAYFFRIGNEHIANPNSHSFRKAEVEPREGAPLGTLPVGSIN